MPSAPLASDFAYPHGGMADAAGLPLALAVYADRPLVRAQVCEDGLEAGYRLAAQGALADLLGGPARPLGEVVVVDCPAPDGAALAALARLDLRAARAGTQLVVATSLDALDAVFGCLDQSDPQLLVDPSAADFALALGRAAARGGTASRVRELAGIDRMALLRLSEQVDRLASELGRLGQLGLGGDDARVSAPAYAFRADHAPASLRANAAALPDPSRVRAVLRARALRARFLASELFADPAWDMLLDLTAAQGEGRRVSVTSLCIAAAVPPTTALRWIGQMIESGLFERTDDPGDRRRAFIGLSAPAREGMARWFAEVGDGALAGA